MSTEPAITGITPVPAPPIDTLAELRRQHSALLQRDVAGGGTARPNPGELLGFLMSAKQLGHSLENPDARETAQGIMDFWIASLLSQAPNAADGTRPFTLEPFDESGAGLVASDAQRSRADAAEAARRADDMIPAAAQAGDFKKPLLSRVLELVPEWMRPVSPGMTTGDDDAHVQQRLLLGFVRLKEKSLEAYSVPLSGDEATLREPRAQELLQRLIQAGVVKQQPAEAGAPPSYALAHESLITKWGLLNEFVMQRRAFRELARGWENGGRHHAALLKSGAQLQQAIDYPNLDNSEQQFLESSRRTGEKNRKVALAFLSMVVIAMLGLIIWLEINYRRLDRALASERDAKEAADSRARELAESNKRLNASYLSFSQLAVQQLKLANTKRSQILSLRDQLAHVQGLPESIASTLDGALTEPADVTKDMVEIFVSLHSNLKPASMADACRRELLKDGFVIPAGVVLPRNVVPDGTTSLTEVRYFHAEDLPLVSKVIAALGRAGIPKEQITTENTTSDTTAPLHFIQISISENWTR